MARDYTFLVGPADAGARLDHYLQIRLPQEVSRTMIQRLIREGVVLVDQHKRKAHYHLQPNETVVAHVEDLPPKPGSVALVPQPIPLEIVFEDAALLVVNKPPGLVTHPAPGHWDGTLVNAVLWHLQQAQSTEALPRAGIVHRLDKDTSGLLLIAKTARAHHVLGRELKARNIKRTYLALVEGHPPLDQGTIDAAIARHPTRRKQMRIQHLGGRRAVTHYRVLRRYDTPVAESSDALPMPYSLVELELETGRTHQIRVHMSHLHMPVIGDLVYGSGSEVYWRSLGVQRQYLHARRLRLKHPMTRLPLDLHAALPADMSTWCDGEGLCYNTNI